MKRASLATLALAAVAAAGGAAHAQERARVYVPDMPVAPATAAAPSSRVLFINDCKPSGCMINPGNRMLSDDSRTNTSYIVMGTPGTPRLLSAYSGSAASWNAIIACVRENYAPYNIEVVTTEPPTSTSYFEAFAAGRPTQLGFPLNNLGVATFNCSVIPNAVSFSFLNVDPNDVLENCWTISQETAHSFGLSHSMLAADAMTYIPSPARKRFVNQTACIGVDGCCQPVEECVCAGDNDEQNSHQKLLSVFGPFGATPPTITIDEPADGASVAPGFPVRATVTDDVGVARVELLIDGAAIASLTVPPFTFTTPATLAAGQHVIGIRATDTTQADGTVTIEVHVGAACEGDGDCAAAGEGFVCVDHRCVPGTGVPGGLGEHCDTPADCLSDFCVNKGGEGRCSEHCDPGGSGNCSDGFTCLEVPGGGACWPGDDGTCAGCSTDGGGSNAPLAPIGAGVMLSALLLRRRRR